MKWARHDSDAVSWGALYVGASLLNRAQSELMGKEDSSSLTKAILQAVWLWELVEVFAQEETADVNFALFVSQGQSWSMPLACTDTHRGKRGFQRGKVKRTGRL